MNPVIDPAWIVEDAPDVTRWRDDKGRLMLVKTKHPIEQPPMAVVIHVEHDGSGEPDKALVFWSRAKAEEFVRQARAVNPYPIGKALILDAELVK